MNHKPAQKRQRVLGTISGLVLLLPGMAILLIVLVPEVAGYVVAVWEGKTATPEWRKILLPGALGAVFVVGGIFFIWVGWREIPHNPRGEKPIASSEKQSYWEYAFMAFAFLVLPSPIVVSVPRELEKGNWEFGLVLMFPLAGLWMGYVAWKTWRNWRFYGPAPLSLDPAPGQIGGDIGGRVTLARRPGDGEWLGTLKCSKRDSDRSDNRNPFETVLWQEDQVPQLRERGQGAEILFCFEPPEDLPASGVQGKDEVVWRLLIKGGPPSLPLERSYQFPVVEGDARSGITLDEGHVTYHQQQEHLRAITEASEQIDVCQGPRGVVLHSRIGRHLGMKLMVLLFGMAFGGFGLWTGSMAAGKGLFLYLFAALFILMALPLMIGGLFMLGRSLIVRIQDGKVTTTRYWLGVPLWRRRGKLTHADQLVFHGGLSVDGQGSRRSEDYLALAVKSGGRKIRIAEGLVGKASGEAFREHLAKLLGLKGALADAAQAPAFRKSDCSKRS